VTLTDEPAEDRLYGFAQVDENPYETTGFSEFYSLFQHRISLIGFPLSI
jgi:hypothetical protein